MFHFRTQNGNRVSGFSTRLHLPNAFGSSQKTQPPEVFFQNSFACCEVSRTDCQSEQWTVTFHDQSGTVKAESIRNSVLVQSTSAFCLGEVVVNCSTPHWASENSLNKTWLLLRSRSRSNWSTLQIQVCVHSSQAFYFEIEHTSSSFCLLAGKTCRKVT